MENLINYQIFMIQFFINKLVIETGFETITNKCFLIIIIFHFLMNPFGNIKIIITLMLIFFIIKI